jgi:hypothetical protein
MYPGLIFPIGYVSRAPSLRNYSKMKLYESESNEENKTVCDETDNPISKVAMMRNMSAVLIGI